MPKSNLPHILPTQAGVEPAAILKVLDEFKKQQVGMHSLMILRHGKVLAECWWDPYTPSNTHMLFSLSKSFTSTAIGFAVQEGLLSLDDKLVSFFPEKLPARPCENMEKLTLRHLLTMTTGHTVEPDIFDKPDPTALFLQSYIDREPGTYFLYNTAGTYMLSAVLQTLTGQTVEDYLTPRLFEPLGIKKHMWELQPNGVASGGFGLNLTTESIARFGQFLLQKGVWEGERLLSEEWVESATSKQVRNDPNPQPDWEQGYGFQFWQCQPEGVFRGDGAFGQFCIVLPKQDMVIAITEGTQLLQDPLTILWDHLLPAIHDEPLPDDPAMQKRLEQRLSSVSWPLPRGSASSATAAKVSGTRYELSPNPDFDAIKIDWDNGPTVVFYRGRKALSCRIGLGQWATGGKVPFTGEGTASCACAGAWEGNTLHLVLPFLYAPFRIEFKLCFDEKGLVLDSSFYYDISGQIIQTQIFGR